MAEVEKLDDKDIIELPTVADLDMESPIPDPYDLPLAEINPANARLFAEDKFEPYFERLREEDPVHLNETDFTGRFWNQKTPGIYSCAGCGTPLFRSSEKFDSGCGWPSYFAPLADDRIDEHRDTSFGMVRVEGSVLFDGRDDRRGVEGRSEEDGEAEDARVVGAVGGWFGEIPSLGEHSDLE